MPNNRCKKVEVDVGSGTTILYVYNFVELMLHVDVMQMIKLSLIPDYRHLNGETNKNYTSEGYSALIEGTVVNAISSKLHTVLLHVIYMYK